MITTAPSLPHPISTLPMVGVRTAETDLEPGQHVHLIGAPANVARYGVVRMQRNPDGTYTPLVKTYSRWIKLSPTTLIELGLINALSKETIHRLIDCCIVIARYPSPGITLIDVDSLLAHIERSRDPHWWTAERSRRYRLGLPMAELL